jgi:di/tricarboxylate transporter
MAAGLPADLVLMTVSAFFCAIRIITVEELLEGLSNSGVVAVAVLCIVSKAIDKTKALNGLMGACLGVPTGTVSAMLRLALPVASLGTVFNNTPLVAVMIPIVKDWTSRTGQEASHFMMPLSFITMLSACITTMGSSTNLLAVQLVPEAHIQFLDLAPVGFVILVTGVSYCCFFASILLPANSDHVVEETGSTDTQGIHARVRRKKVAVMGIETDDAKIEVDRYTVFFALGNHGPLHQRSAESTGILHCVQPPARIRFLDDRGSKDEKRVMDCGDILCLENATAADIAGLVAVPGLNLQSLGGQFRSAEHQAKRYESMNKEAVQLSRFAFPVRKWVAANLEGGWVASQRELFEIVIAPGGIVKAGRRSCVGATTLEELQKPLSAHNCTLIAVRGVPQEQSSVLALQGGEVLLVEALSADFSHDALQAFMMVLPVREEAPPAGLNLSPLDPFRPACSVLGLAGCVILSALKIAELDAVALLVGLACIASGTLTNRELYGAINGPVLLTVASSFGVGAAFHKTGLASTLAKSVLMVAESSGQYAILGSVVGLALLLGVVVSNNTTVILLAPLVKDISQRQHMDLKMMMLAVIYAANLSFATPFSYQTNMMVMPHGKYVFMDYVKFGIPMMILCGAVALAGTIYIWG